MTAIVWRRQLSVGQPAIDEDHKHLIQYLNDLGSALDAPQYHPARVAKILVKLLEYTKEHFAREEKLMRLANYPRIEDHIHQHRIGVFKISELSKEFATSPTRECGHHIYAFTADWLVHHIIMEDTQLTPYVRGVWL